ncbi:hypothetical protein Tco_0836261, partial [Tanacetum coccineum]
SRSAHRILHNLFKSLIQATMSVEATKSGDKLQTFNIHVKANDIKQNKTHLTCGNCGMSRHTTYQCFELIGYPDWWNDGHNKGNKNRGLERGKASASNTGTDRKNSTGLGGMAATTVNEEDGSFSMSTTQNYNINKKQSWIFDCGATDTMTYDLSYFATSTKPTKSYIHTANGQNMNSRSAHRILHNLFKSLIQATMLGEATKSGDKLQTFNLHVKANDIKQNKTHLTCGNCGMLRHTTDQCFKLIGYLDWWNYGHKKGNKNRGLERGKASAANTGTDRKNSTGLGGWRQRRLMKKMDPSQ